MYDVYFTSFIEILFGTNETTKLISHIRKYHHQIKASKRSSVQQISFRAVEARSEIDFRDTVSLINITLVY